jgi:hypothetical protein
MHKYLRTSLLLIGFTLLTACASSARVKSDFDSSVDLSEYRTFNFSNPTEIQNPEFPELLGIKFSEAVERQMLLRGYTKADNPDVLIHVLVDVEDKSKAPKGRTCPRYGDYYSRGIVQYQSYSLGSANYQPAGGRRTICNFTEGAIKVDMTGVELDRTVWTGVSLVRIDENDRNLVLARHIINDTHIMFENYPSRTYEQIAGVSGGN